MVKPRQATKDLYPYFRAARKQVAEVNAEYDAMVREAYKQGYGPEYCRHGTYLYRDYNVICRGCEGPYESDLERAYDIAKQAKAYFDREAQNLVELQVALLSVVGKASYEVANHLTQAIKQAQAELDQLYKEITN